jgi:hypothetical protein
MSRPCRLVWAGVRAARDDPRGRNKKGTKGCNAVGRRSPDAHKTQSPLQKANSGNPLFRHLPLILSLWGCSITPPKGKYPAHVKIVIGSQLGRSLPMLDRIALGAVLLTPLLLLHAHGIAEAAIAVCVS